MKRIPFERPTEHYEESIFHIDEQICSLLKQRKERSDHNPGYPPFAYIEKWAARYDLYTDFLKFVFNALNYEEHYKSVVQPEGFRKHIPVHKSVEQGEFFYTVISVRQYNNASVVTFNMDWDVHNESLNTDKPMCFEMELGEPYECRMDTGGSHAGHSSFTYVVTPPLPDYLKDIAFIFRELGRFKDNKPAGTVITLRVD